MKKFTIFIMIISTIVAITSTIFLIYSGIQIQNNIEAINNNRMYITIAHYIEELDDEPKKMHIPFEFYIFSDSSFESEIIEKSESRYISIINEIGDWIEFYFEDGYAWIYRYEIYILNIVAGIYENKFDYYYIDLIEPQILIVLDRYDYWILTNTDMGEKWVYTNFTPPIYILQEIAQRFEDNISIFYKNLNSGFTFSNNADRVYFGASVTKAPFAFFIYKLAEAGLTDMNMPISFTHADYWGGSGIIRHRYYFGETFPQYRVLGLNLYESDNIATRMLRRTHGVEGYYNFIKSIGGNTNFVHNITFSEISAYEAGIWAYNIFNYIVSDYFNYNHMFKYQLLSNKFKFLRSDYPIASKTGWDTGNFGGAWHDMSIVLAPSPYILVVLSNAQMQNAFWDISDIFQDFNRRYFR